VPWKPYRTPFSNPKYSPNPKKGTTVRSDSQRGVRSSSMLGNRAPVCLFAGWANSRTAISSATDRESDPHGRQERSEAFLSNGMDQQEADDKHHRAGYAMN
jgi:hypothetical protein